MCRASADLLVVLVLDGNVADVTDGRSNACAKVLLGVGDLAERCADTARRRRRRLGTAITRGEAKTFRSIELANITHVCSYGMNRAAILATPAIPLIAPVIPDPLAASSSALAASRAAEAI